MGEANRAKQYNETVLLPEYRKKYPFETWCQEGRPESFAKYAKWKGVEFARLPLPTGNLWLFETEEGLQVFNEWAKALYVRMGHREVLGQAQKRHGW